MTNFTLRWTPYCAGIMYFIRKTPSRTCLLLQLKISQSKTSEMAPSSGSAAPTAQHTYLAIPAAPMELRTAGNFIAKQTGLRLTRTKLWRSWFLSPDRSVSNVKNQRLQNSAQPACLPLGRAGATHIAPVFPRSQQWKPLSGGQLQD